MEEAPYPAINRVINSEIIHQYFGYWPNFHDAEVIKVTFETHITGRYSVTFVIEAFEMLAEVDAQGFYKQAKQCLIEIQFSGVEEIDFKYFNFQNVLFEFWFEEQGSLIKGIFNSSTGMEATVVAEEALVLSLAPIKSVTKRGSRGGAQPLGY
ncbi:hypothetical protein GCM10011375_01410 [Hymenobacter qilianensis]|uniref:Uncharacterized protein n=2 Tax=Hymenobacter qilianensis TaxID=1385715 RepID=A0ACB5PLA5_9BACT|nr:Imm50 family immunity protein [Hymenobacter qilianensis]QNP50902.1 hypothetical protein H9L05_12085 [Hymenobacter qilianensis]GGF49611.1 hypothetical protein GCM10011375_01410 [Hymenobacter qilianensis]